MMRADAMRPISPLAALELQSREDLCGQPADAEYFDDSGIFPLPPRGGEQLLARFALTPRYCGRLENFCQFTDAHAREADEIATPGLQWLLTMNGRPLSPYLNMERIVNPWGWGAFPFSIRLDENAVVELRVRNTGYAPPVPADSRREIKRVGGRILGRFWFNPAYGHAAPRRS